MNLAEAKKQIAQLRDQLNKANDAYYQEATPLMTDREFDRLLEDLRNLEEQFGLESQESPTQRIGGKPTKEFPTVRHPVPMLSLSNTYNSE